jgi:formate-dependent nitrite reductase membrane component NrfD
MPPLYTPYRQPFPPTVGRVVFAGVVLLIFGVAGTVAGIAGAIFASALRRLFDQALRDQGIRVEQGALINVVAGFFVVLLLLGVLHIVAASGVLSHGNWGRVLGILLCGLGVALSALLLVRAGLAPPASAPRGVVAALALLLPYGVSLISLLFAGAHFGQRRRRG